MPIPTSHALAARSLGPLPTVPALLFRAVGASLLLITLLISIATPVLAVNDPILDNLKPKHPRLLIDESIFDRLQKQRKDDPNLDVLLKRVESDARAMLPLPPLKHEKIGRRLLTISRTAIRRILTWSFAYRLTGDDAFLKKAQEEMLNLAAFEDWNPEHFLDVGEMTTALAIGYDWLFDQLSPEARQKIRAAIVEKGLQQGVNMKDKNNWWYLRHNNWNQVCGGGLSLGALAIAEDEPALASLILHQVKDNNANGMAPYVPDGVYPEGPGYWGYGTTYEVILISALRTALGTDWNIPSAKGFLASADYMVQMTAPTGLMFNYADGGEKGGLQQPLFWFAHEKKEPAILLTQQRYLEAMAKAEPPTQAKIESAEPRFLPLTAVWWEKLDPSVKPTIPLYWQGKGEVPLAVFREAWTPEALYLGVKAGSASSSHGHMDAGSFILEADGVRWARDLGAQDYNSLESKGIALFSGEQTSTRWKVFRVGPFSHNTLTINGQVHLVAGHATMPRVSLKPDNAFSVVDLSDVFKGQATKVIRGFKVLPKRQVLIQDTLEGLKEKDDVRWAMMTGAEVTVNGSEATLKHNGKTLQARLLTPGQTFEVTSGDPPKNDYDAPNPDTHLLLVHAKAPGDGKVRIEVLLQAGEGAVELPKGPTPSAETW